MREKPRAENSAPFVHTLKKALLETSSPFAPGSREEDAWLSERQFAQCARADETDVLHSPIPTQMVSNGEYMPFPQTEKQRRVEARIKELADSASRKLGISRRKFLATTGGFAAAFLAMNEVFGRFFNVNPIDLLEPAAYAATGVPPNVFVLDDQLHTVRSSINLDNLSLRAIAEGLHSGLNPNNVPDELGGVNTPWNPSLVGLPDVSSEFQLVQFIKDVYLDSQVTVGIISNNNSAAVPDVTGTRPPTNITESEAHQFLTAQQTVAVRNFVNSIAGSTRMLAHGQLYPGIGNERDPVYGDFTQWQIDNLHPDSWKGYNIATAAKLDFDPASPMVRWQLDDEVVAYPMYQIIANNKEQLKDHPGFFNICVHKGLSTNAPADPKLGYPGDVPKAAGDWPQFNFVIYHACIRPGFWVLNALNDVRSGNTLEGVPHILWTTDLAVLGAPFRNVYAELGTTFASSVITFPTVCAHIIGTFLKFFGDERIVFGSDSVWYGGPQWQIEAFWRFQIPEELQQQYGYPALTEASRRKILGLNSARLYKLPAAAQGQTEGHEHGLYKPVPANYESLISDELKRIMEFPGFTADDKLSKFRNEYLARGGERDNTRYGWIRTAA
jgi:hypothetical protein